MIIHTVMWSLYLSSSLLTPTHRACCSCSAVAQMLSTMLYYRRFFPYYTYNILAGLDSEGKLIFDSHTVHPTEVCVCERELLVAPPSLPLGKGCVYSFDPVGSYDRETYRAGGSAASMLQPLLDNQVYPLILSCLRHLSLPPSLPSPSLSLSLDWVEEPEWCGETASLSGEGRSSSPRRVQCSYRERYLHRRRAADQHHHSSWFGSQKYSST